MIRNIKELLDEESNLRHFIQHASIDILNDKKATKEDLIKSVMEGIEEWKMHMICTIVDHETSMVKDKSKHKKFDPKKNIEYLRKGKSQ